MLIEILVPIGLLLVLGKLVEGVFGRIGLSSIFAYVATGVVLGPLLGIVESNDELEVFLSIGIFVLFFIVGLDEIDVPGFVATMRGRYFVAAMVSVVLSLMAALVVTSDLFGLSFSLGLEFKSGLALAGILSMSSLGLVAKVLHDGGHLREPIGLKIFAVVIIAEVTVLLIVGFTIGEHEHELALVSVLTLFAKMAGFVVVSWLLSKRVLPPLISLLQRFIHVPELSFGLLIGGLFLVVAGAEEMELHGSIGALLFGTALSALPERVRHDVMPGMRSVSEGLFVPLFFASAGLNFDLSFTELPAATIVALVLIPLAGKFVGAFMGTYLVRVDAPFAMAAGLMAKGVAEIAFLLVLLETEVIEQDVFSLLVLIMFGYILLMPLMIDFAVNRVKVTEKAKAPSVVPASFARYALEGIKVASVMDRAAAYPDSDTTVRRFADEWMATGEHDYVVVDDGEVSGIVSVVKLHLVARSLWSSTPLSDVLRHDTPTASPDEPLHEVLERMAEHSLTVIPVLASHSGEFLGTVTSREVMDLLQLIDEVQDHLKEQDEGQTTSDS